MCGLRRSPAAAINSGEEGEKDIDIDTKIMQLKKRKSDLLCVQGKSASRNEVAEAG